MKLPLPLTVIAVAALAGVATAAPGPVSAVAAPTMAQAVPAVAAQAAGGMFARTDWDDDGDDRRRYGPMPRPDIRALSRAGFVHVTDVERDDGQLEIEGYDAQGRKMEARMDLRGQRVLRAWHERDDDDRWDD